MISQPVRLRYSLDPLIAEAKQRARRRRMLLAAALVLVGAAAAAGVVETRSPSSSNVAHLSASWHDAQICRDRRPGDGIAITSNTQPGKVLGLIGYPMRVSMGFAAASGIARHVGPSEFQPAGTHGAAPQVVPCNVALDVADRAGNRWGALKQRHFGIAAGWAGYSGAFQFGFECVLRDAGSRTLVGTCLHEPSRRAGAVTTRFLIRRPA